MKNPNARVIFLSILMLFFLTGKTFSQTSMTVESDDTKNRDNKSKEITANAQLAMSVPNYPVTAGDVYTLAFLAGSSPVTYSIPVDTSYKIRVANLGVISCAGLTYPQLKAQVEQVVNKNYPLSGVQFSLTAPAVFLVSITGEVKGMGFKPACRIYRTFKNKIFIFQRYYDNFIFRRAKNLRFI